MQNPNHFSDDRKNQSSSKLLSFLGVNQNQASSTASSTSNPSTFSDNNFIRNEPPVPLPVPLMMAENINDFSSLNLGGHADNFNSFSGLSSSGSSGLMGLSSSFFQNSSNDFFQPNDQLNSSHLNSNNPIWNDISQVNGLGFSNFSSIPAPIPLPIPVSNTVQPSFLNQKTSILSSIPNSHHSAPAPTPPPLPTSRPSTIDNHGLSSNNPFTSKSPENKMKSNVLMSILKSNINMKQKSVSHGEAACPPESAQTDPLVERIVEANVSSAPTPSTDINDENDEIEEQLEEEGIKKKLTTRSSKNQQAMLYIKVKQGSRNPSNSGDDFVVINDGYYIRPGNFLTLQWQLPVAVADSLPTTTQLSVNLLRYGSSTNMPAIVSKRIPIICGGGEGSSKLEDEVGEGDNMRKNNLKITKTRVKNFKPNIYYQVPYNIMKNEESKEDEEIEVYSGFFTFYAPKAAGQFVFRLFDSESRESSRETLGSSAMFTVSLVDSDVISNLKHVYETFLSNCFQNQNGQQATTPASTAGNPASNQLQYFTNSSKPINQFGVILKSIKSFSPSLNHEVGLILNNFIYKMNEEISISIGHIEKYEEYRKMKELQEDTGEETTEEAQAAQSEMARLYRFSKKIHLEAHEVFTIITTKKSIWYPISEKQKFVIKQLLDRFCPINKRFYRSHLEFRSSQFSFLHFYPAVDTNLSTFYQKNPAVFNHLDEAIENLLPKLIPNFAEFNSKREKAREQIERDLHSVGVLPSNVKLTLYGSSNNNFGTEGSDMDMCLVYPSSSPALSPEQKVELIENIGEALRKLGMMNVSIRSTARIPIIEFKDILTNLDCDISIHNNLALANTKLLKIISYIDPRIRKMAYIIKNWAKSRNINTPVDGTLSSYGYILTLVHFLQNRSKPLLPTLEEILIDPSTNENLLDNDIFFNPSLSEEEREQLLLNNNYIKLLQEKAGLNTESLSFLLLEYFRYYSWNFDFKNKVVSIRNVVSYYNKSPGNVINNTINKSDKCERNSWFFNDILAIEDPFETWYDVAHVIRPNPMKKIHSEFLRAYSLGTRLFFPAPGVTNVESIPNEVNPDQFLNLLFEKVEDEEN